MLQLNLKEIEMNEKDLIELHAFSGLDDSDGNAERSSLIFAFEDLRGRDYLIQTEGFLKVMEKEVEGQLKWYRENFKIVEESERKVVTRNITRLESIT